MKNFSNSTRLNEKLVFREWDFWDYSLLLCLIFGTIGNSLSIMVMSSKKLRNSNAALFVSDK
jgi:hypothetical protein